MPARHAGGDKAEAAAASALLRRVMGGLPLDWSPPHRIFGAEEPPTPELMAVFLRAAGGRQDGAYARYHAYLQWRRDSFLDTPQLSAVWGEAQGTGGKYYSDFHDAEGRPVVVSRARFHSAEFTAEQQRASSVHIFDAAVRAADARGGGDGRFSVLFDLRGAAAGAADLDGGKVLLDTLQHYPGRLASVWLVGGPGSTAAVLPVVQFFLPAELSAALKVVSEAELGAGVMREWIPPAVLPAEYGGDAPDPPVPFIGSLQCADAACPPQALAAARRGGVLPPAPAAATAYYGVWECGDFYAGGPYAPQRLRIERGYCGGLCCVKLISDACSTAGCVSWRCDVEPAVGAEAVAAELIRRTPDGDYATATAHVRADSADRLVIVAGCGAVGTFARARAPASARAP